MMTAIKIVFVVLLLVPIALLMRYLIVRLSSESPAQTDSDVPVLKRKLEPADATSSGKGNATSSDKGRATSSDKGRATFSGKGNATSSGKSNPSSFGSGKGQMKRRKNKKDRNGSFDVGQDRAANGKQAGSGRTVRDQIGVNGGVSTAAQGSGSSYTPRQPEQWQRSERVPFGESEGYRVDPPKKRPIAENPDFKQWKKPSDALKERNMEEAARSEDLSKRDETTESVAFEKEEKAKKKRKRSEKSPSKRQLRKNRERARKRDMKRRKEGRDS